MIRQPSPRAFRICLFAFAVLMPGVSSFSGSLRADEFQYPLGITATKDGTLYAADLRLPGIWKITDGKPEVYFKASKKFRTPLNAVRCVAISKDGKLLAGDSATREIYRFDAPDKPVPLTKGFIGIPMAIAVAKDGTLYVADIEVHRIWKLPPTGGQPEEVATIGSVRGLAFDDQERLWVLSTSSKKGQVQRVLPDGKVETVISDFPFEMPHNIVVGPDDTVWVSDNYANAIWKFGADKKPVKAITGKPLVRPVGLFRLDKQLLIADPHAKAIFSADESGKISTIAATGK